MLMFVTPSKQCSNTDMFVINYDVLSLFIHDPGESEMHSSISDLLLELVNRCHLHEGFSVCAYFPRKNLSYDAAILCNNGGK